MMVKLCPTCRGKGTIPDPEIGSDVIMSYYDAQGNSWPQVTCRTCGGSGWIQEPAHEP